jgi:hypothetical protein
MCLVLDLKTHNKEGTMQKYLGVKIVEAKPMILGDYNNLKGWAIPSDEDPTTEGYIVTYPDGYVSWCPKKQFEEANRPITGLSFGYAIEAAKVGHRIARAGWNGKDMWVSYSPGYQKLETENIWTPHIKKVSEENGGNVTILPYFNLKTADNKILCGWLASQSDMLADDWSILNEA